MWTNFSVVHDQICNSIDQFEHFLCYIKIIELEIKGWRTNALDSRLNLKRFGLISNFARALEKARAILA